MTDQMAMAAEEEGPAVREGRTKPRIHDAVLRNLGARVLRGDVAPGAVLPNAEDLCRTLGISRTALREAVKVLSAKGLVESRPGVGIRVRPREDWNLLDPVVLSWHPDIAMEPLLLRSLVEARRLVEPAAAAMAAERATAVDLAGIETALDRMRSAAGDIEAFAEADFDFHAALVGAARNVVFTNLLGTIGAVLTIIFQVSKHLSRTVDDVLAAHADVVERVRMRDAEGARLAMNRLLDLGERNLAPVMGARSGTGTGTGAGRQALSPARGIDRSGA